jgi:hypothetical protein
MEITLTHGLRAVRENRHLLTSSLLDLAFSAKVNATTTQSQPTYASRVRALKLFAALRPRLRLRVRLFFYSLLWY